MTEHIFRRRDRLAEAETNRPQDDPNSHLGRIYKLATIDDLMKGFGIDANKPRSQRGASNVILPNPPRSSRHEKFKDKGGLNRFDSVDRAVPQRQFNNMLKVKLPSLYRSDNPLMSSKLGVAEDRTNDYRGIGAGFGIRREPAQQPRNEEVGSLARNNSQAITVKRRLPEAALPLQEPDAVPTGGLVFNVGVKSRAGRVGVNRKINQDNYVINQLFFGSGENAFFSVLDGHGNDGHKVSHFMKMNLGPTVAKELKKVGVPPESIFSENAHAAMIKAFLGVDAELNKQNGHLTDVSGSTCVAVLAMKDKLICANLGDSCAALVSADGDDWQLQMLNREHKPTEKDERDRVESSNGRVEPFRDQFGQFIGPLRIWRKFEQMPGLMMSRSFGDVRAHTCGVISTPEIRNFKIDKTSKALVLGSDGLWEVISTEKIKGIVARHYKSRRSEDAASELLEAAQAGWGKKNPMYCDDITCLVVYFNHSFVQQLHTDGSQ